MALCEVLCVLVEGPIAGRYVDCCENDLVGHVVEVHGDEADALVPPTKVNLIEDLQDRLVREERDLPQRMYRDVDEVKTKGRSKEYAAKLRVDHKTDG